MKKPSKQEVSDFLDAVERDMAGDSNWRPFADYQDEINERSIKLLRDKCSRLEGQLTLSEYIIESQKDRVTRLAVLVLVLAALSVALVFGLPKMAAAIILLVVAAIILVL